MGKLGIKKMNLQATKAMYASIDNFDVFESDLVERK
jgi:hypothetical protein